MTRTDAGDASPEKKKLPVHQEIHTPAVHIHEAPEKKKFEPTGEGCCGGLVVLLVSPFLLGAWVALAVWAYRVVSAWLA